jgi:hypothetical protein
MCLFFNLFITKRTNFTVKNGTDKYSKIAKAVYNQGYALDNLFTISIGMLTGFFIIIKF